MRIEVFSTNIPPQRNRFNQSEDGDIMIVTGVDEGGDIMPGTVVVGEVLINVQGHAVGFDNRSSRFWERNQQRSTNVGALRVRFLQPGESVTLTQREEA